MTRMSLMGYALVQLDRFLQPFVPAVPGDYAKSVKELFFDPDGFRVRGRGSGRHRRNF